MREVTILFTDVEGSTALARALGPAWHDLIAVHHGILERAIALEGGVVERTAGDSFFALFDDPGAALSAAASAQLALEQEPWPDAAPPVRMGIHTGAVTRTAGELQGLDIHLAARVMAAAHGRQVLVSDATRRALEHGPELLDMGEHRLKDFPAPERLWMLVHDDRRPEDFPPLRTEPVRPTNLPAEPRPLVGRDTELARLRALLAEERLVTVVGLGGTGKTRLAVAAGEALLGAFQGGVWLVALAGVRDPTALLGAIAAVVGRADGEGLTAVEAVAQRLRARPALLVLDNFEQLVEAAPLVASLLEQAPDLRVLVTSQRPLRVSAEHVFELAPLGIADAVALFRERAAAIAPGFRPDEHRAAIAEICRRLDGMPLAVELAAARVTVLEPDALLERLDRSLAVLVRGPRDLPERHRSLRAALEWTHELLDQDERTLLARLGAFAGPAPFDAVEAVAAEPAALDALDALAGLVEASLVRREEDRELGVRYAVPQAARDFAAEQLAASGEEAAVRRALAVHLVSLAAGFGGVGVPDTVRRRVNALEAEQHPALAWAREHDPELHLRLASALGIFLYHAGQVAETAEELGAAIAACGITGTEGGWAAVVRAFALQSQGEYEQAPALAEAGLAELRRTGEELTLELGLRLAGLLWGFAGDPERGLAYATEALSLARASGDAARMVTELLMRGQALVQLGRLDEAEALFDEAEPLLPLAGDGKLVLGTFRGDVALERGDWAGAARGYVESALSAHPRSNQVISDLQLIAYALLRLDAIDDALELDAVAAGIAEATGLRGMEDYFPPGRVDAMRAAHARFPERAEAAARRARAVGPERAARRASELVERLRA